MDPVYANLIPALWLLWLAYWFIAGRNVKPTQRHESVASRASHIVPLIVGVVLLWPEKLPPGLLSGRIFPPSRASYLAGVAVVAAGLAFTVWARIHLGRNWSGTVTVKQDHELVRDGPYRHVRHPIYTGLLLAFIGCSIARDEWRGVLGVVIICAGFWRKLRLEERWMTEQFGAAYRRYMTDVPALVPDPFHRRSTTA